MYAYARTANQRRRYSAAELQSQNVQQYRSDRRRELMHVALYIAYLCMYLCANKVIDVI